MPVTNYFTANGRIIGETTAGSARLDYVRDALGSVIATVDQTKTVQSTARYKPYGDVLSSTGAQPAFGWNGTSGYLKSAGMPHSEYSVRARIYGSQAGQWTSLDPLWPATPGFAYVLGRVILKNDPSGLDPTGQPCKCLTGPNLGPCPKTQQCGTYTIPPSSTQYTAVAYTSCNQLTGQMWICSCSSDACQAALTCEHEDTHVLDFKDCCQAAFACAANNANADWCWSGYLTYTHNNSKWTECNAYGNEIALARLQQKACVADPPLPAVPSSKPDCKGIPGPTGTACCADVGADLQNAKNMLAAYGCPQKQKGQCLLSPPAPGTTTTGTKPGGSGTVGG